jgi:hypothetical protein
MNKYIQDAADYWAKDNAQFEASNPTTGNRILRALNPMTGFGFGPAMGAMKTAAEEGNKRDMALAALQAVPMFGFAKLMAHKGIYGPLLQSMNMWGKTGKGVAANVASGVAVDEVQASELRK